MRWDNSYFKRGLIDILDREQIDYEFCAIKDVIYLDTSMAAVPPKCVQDAYLGFFKESINTYNESILGKAWYIAEETRNELARLVGAQAEEIAFVKNTAEGIGILASGYPLHAGENVIVSEIEHASNLYAWINLQKKGIKLYVLPGYVGKCSAEDFMEAADERTKIIAVSAVQFTSGYYIDLLKLGDFCRQRGIILAVDGIQAIGRLNMDVKRYAYRLSGLWRLQRIIVSFWLWFRLLR